jgi:hypothetical protein
MVPSEAPATAPWPRYCIVATAGAGGRPDTRSSASCGQPTCGASATYARDHGRCEPPDGRRGNSSATDYGPRSQAARGSLVDRTRESKKRFCRVTTRRCNFRLLSSLERGLSPLAARAFSVGVLGLGLGGQPMFGLALGGLPAPELPLAFQILAVALVPTPRSVLPPALPAQADPHARSARPGRAAVFSRTLDGAQGSSLLPRESSGGMRQRSPRAPIETRTKRLRSV